MLVLAPERQDARVERGEVDPRRDLAEPGLALVHVPDHSSAMPEAPVCALLAVGVLAGAPILPDRVRMGAMHSASETPRPAPGSLEHVLILLDYDGTITTRECNEVILQRFTGDAWRRLEEAVLAGNMSHAACFAQQIGLVTASHGELVAAAVRGRRDRARVRPVRAHADGRPARASPS